MANKPPPFACQPSYLRRALHRPSVRCPGRTPSRLLCDLRPTCAAEPARDCQQDHSRQSLRGGAAPRLKAVQRCSRVPLSRMVGEERRAAGRLPDLFSLCERRTGCPRGRHDYGCVLASPLIRSRECGPTNCGGRRAKTPALGQGRWAPQSSGSALMGFRIRRFVQRHACVFHTISGNGRAGPEALLGSEKQGCSKPSGRGDQAAGAE